MAVLRQGRSPDRVALALAAGAVIGIFPAPGLTVAICVVLGVVLRLNHVALQAANYAVYPLHLALLIPFYHVAAARFGYEIPVESATQVVALVTEQPFGAVQVLWGVTWRAAILWAIAAVPAVAVLYLPLRMLTRSALAGTSR